jgi:hypothetical protein
MDILSGKFGSGGDRPALMSAVVQTIRGITRWLVGLFTLTEEDREKAGIQQSGDGRYS